MPAPVAAPLLPSMRAPAAAPTAVPIAAFCTPLSAEAWLGVVPPTCELANCRQSKSSARNWSKLLPVPGSDMMLGPLGTVTHAPSVNTAAMDKIRNVRFVAGLRVESRFTNQAHSPGG